MRLFFVLLLSCGVLQSQTLRYEQNKGQWQEEILFMARSSQMTIFVTQEGITFLAHSTQPHAHSADAEGDLHKHKQGNNAHVFRLSPVKTKNQKSQSPQQMVEAEEELDGYANYFLSNDQSKWRSGVKSYGKVVFKDVFPHIDWVISSKDGNFKHEFHLKSGSDINDIRLCYEGLSNLRLESGDIAFETALGDFREKKPVSYLLINGVQTEVSADFLLNADTLSFALSARDAHLAKSLRASDAAKEDFVLVIDPMLVFSTLSGSNDDNFGFTATYDRDGFFYAGGITMGYYGYPTTIGAYQDTNRGQWDVSLTKFSQDGSSLIFSTYLGGRRTEYPSSLYVNSSGELLVFGVTSSDNFPTFNAFQSTFGGGEYSSYMSDIFENGTDIFVSKFSSDGTNLVSSTYIGGSRNDGLNYQIGINITGDFSTLYANYADGVRGEIITDDNDNVFIGSCTFSEDFPTTANAFQRNIGGGLDGIVIKLDRNLSSLLFSSYLGGTNDDAIYSVDCDTSYRLYVTGGTLSSDFPVTNYAYQTQHTGARADGFLSLVSYDGSQLIASTYYGTASYDQSYFVRRDRNNFPHIFGQTSDGGMQMRYGNEQNDLGRGQFIAKFSPDLRLLQWGGLFGSPDPNINISPSAFGVDNCGRVYVSGWGRIFKYGYASSPAPDPSHPFGTDDMVTTPDAVYRQTDGMDFYIACFTTEPLDYEFGTFFGEINTANRGKGNDHVDGGTSRFDRYGNLYQSICSGCGEGDSSFPTTPNAWSNQQGWNVNCNLAAVKFNVHSDFAVSEFDYPPIVCVPANVQFTNLSRGDRFQWFFGDGTSSTYDNPSHEYSQSGVYEVMLVSYIDNSCWESDTVRHYITVLGGSTDTLPDISVCRGIPTQIGLVMNTGEDVSYQWYPQYGLSNPTIPDPYATINDTTTYMLVIVTPYCRDTILQRINLSLIDMNVPDSLYTCSLPFRFDSVANLSSNYTIASWNRDFSDTIFPIRPPTGNPYFELSTSTDRYVYFKQFESTCNGMDSCFVTFGGMLIDIETSSTTCSYTNDGSMTAHIYNVLSNSEYEVLHPQSGTTYPLAITQDTTIQIGGYAKGDYTIEVRNAAGCITKQSFVISSPDSLMLNVSNTDNNCADGCGATAIANVIGGLQPYQYLWSNGDAAYKADSLCVGYYNVTISDSLGCRVQAAINVGSSGLYDNFSVTASSTHVYDQETIVLAALPKENGVSYHWTPEINLSDPYSNTTRATIYEPITYTVTIDDGNGCLFVDNIKIECDIVVCEEPNIHVPNIFTPNNDGKNDILMLSGEFIRKVKFIIFDRWGEQVFETTDQNEGWDGRYRGKDCQNGVYYYRLEVECEADRNYTTSGDITLIR